MYLKNFSELTWICDRTSDDLYSQCYFSLPGLWKDTQVLGMKRTGEVIRHWG